MWCLASPLCFKGRTFGTHSLYVFLIPAQLRKCRVVMNRLAALRHSPFLLAALSARAEGRTLRCARLSAALAAHGVAIVADMGLSVSGQRGEWAALSVAVCVHKKRGCIKNRCALFF